MRYEDLQPGDLITINQALDPTAYSSPLDNGPAQIWFLSADEGLTVMLHLGFDTETCRYYFVGPGGVGYRYADRATLTLLVRV
jgi:hypothetical protein